MIAPADRLNLRFYRRELGLTGGSVRVSVQRALGAEGNERTGARAEAVPVDTNAVLVISQHRGRPVEPLLVRFIGSDR
jgi:hypothetical protein